MTNELIAWLAGGERGISSNTIVQMLTGLPTLGGWRPSHPHDPADLRRCVLLLESCPDLAERFGEMAVVSREWRALVAIWPQLVAMMDEEVPGWRRPRCKGEATRTYRMMRDAIDSCSKEAP